MPTEVFHLNLKTGLWEGMNNWKYDNIDQLTEATHPALPEENFTYNPLGNRNPLTHTYDIANRLLSDDQYTYTFDANGNRITKEDPATGEIITYTYNAENQLTSVDNGLSTVNYFYDGLGRRIEKNTGGEITRYVYDGMDVLAEYNAANELIRNYVHGPSVDEPLELRTGPTTYYYISDGLGSITAIIDGSGNIIEQYRYDSFGNTTILNPAGEEIPESAYGNRYMFTAREYDAETGLYYYRLRYYDPLVGRFLQEDPVGYLLGPNLYTYVYNNPVNSTDPFGLFEPFTVGVIVGGAIALWDTGTYYVAEKYYNWKYGVDITANEVYAKKATVGIISSVLPIPKTGRIFNLFWYKSAAVTSLGWLSYGSGKFIEKTWDFLQPSELEEYRYNEEDTHENNNAKEE